MKLIDVLNDDYAPLRGLRPKAHLQFRLSITKFAKHLGREPLVSDLTGVTVQRFLSERRGQVSVATAVKDRTHLCAIWNHLFRLRRVDVAPAAVLPPMRAPKRIPKAYRAEEVAAIVRAALALPGHVSQRPAKLWHASLIRAAFETAERVGALLQTEWRDVDLEERTILLRAETRKGGYRDLLRPISSETAAWIAEMRRGAGDKDLVWQWDKTHQYLWKIFSKICDRAGVTPRGYHGLRKSAASYIAAAGGLGQAASALGHHSPTTTATHYIDQTIARPDRSYLSMLPRLDLGQPPAGNNADAAEAAQRAGYARGRAIGAEGEACPRRPAQDEFAAAEGIHADLWPLFRQGLVLGWAKAQEDG